MGAAPRGNGASWTGGKTHGYPTRSPARGGAAGRPHEYNQPSSLLYLEVLRRTARSRRQFPTGAWTVTRPPVILPTLSIGTTSRCLQGRSLLFPGILPHLATHVLWHQEKMAPLLSYDRGAAPDLKSWRKSSPFIRFTKARRNFGCA